MQTHDSTVRVPAVNLNKQQQQRGARSHYTDTDSPDSVQQLLGEGHVDSVDPAAALTARHKKHDQPARTWNGLQSSCLKNGKQKGDSRQDAKSWCTCLACFSRRRTEKPTTTATASSGVFSFLDFLCLRATPSDLHLLKTCIWLCSRANKSSSG